MPFALGCGAGTALSSLTCEGDIGIGFRVKGSHRGKFDMRKLEIYRYIYIYIYVHTHSLSVGLQKGYRGYIYIYIYISTYQA